LDNVTHSIVGLFMAEALIVFRERTSSEATPSRARSAAVLVSVLGNNAPDVDSAYASLITDPLGSLLHHRGHTHTLMLVPLLAALSLGATLGIVRLQNVRFDRREIAWLFALGFAGVLVHIGLDSTNNYGVHPFWPFYDGWLYGDSIFIIEPWLWAALVPPLVFSFKPRWAKIALAVLVLIGVGLCWLRELVPRSMALVVTLLAACTAIAGHRATPTGRVVVSALATLAVFSTFRVSRSTAHRIVESAVARNFPRAVTHDTVLTPMPADPLCWQVVVVQTEGERYVARSGMVATIPSFLASDECPFDSWATPTAPSEPVRVRPEPSLMWVREFSAPLRELRELSEESCVFSALLRFARAPFWTRDRELGRVAGDVRYDRSAGLDFSDTVLDGVACPKNLPPWTPPRKALLEAR
jgi:inner membrane protein